ncbi:MAG: hypothetical protein JWO38_2226 [Gemmataceae bacterium]|nr:hypothetical protein [Gemmataceae bacterium]
MLYPLSYGGNLICYTTGLAGDQPPVEMRPREPPGFGHFTPELRW